MMFSCKRCGYCCTLIPKITLAEKLRLMFHGYHGFTEKDAKGRLSMKMVDGDCFFLVRGETRTFCKIYPLRPKVCRDFPGTEECNVDKRSFRERMIGK